MFVSSAQTNRRISGRITDTTDVGLPGIKVILVAGKDTLSLLTDDNGNFRYSNISITQFSLQVIDAGLENFKSNYTFSEKEKHMRLDAIRLKISAQMLKEVVVRAKPVPIRFMQDTVEYDVRAFRVQDGDNVADLLKQFPGMEVNEGYDVKVGDQPMTKLRVNGKDFFTNNVKDFIARLPAGIVSKIQVIDDFGDLANFTGIKAGEPVKMLNIVTKPGRNKGAFGNISGSGGTNDMIGGNAQVNLWNDSRQSSANINVNTANNGAGRSQQLNIGLNHRDKLGPNSTGGFGYNTGQNNAAFNREQVTESLNPQGNFITKNKSDGYNKGSNNTIRLNLNHSNDKFFLQLGINGGYNKSNNQSTSLIRQYGIIRQDLNNDNSLVSTSPSVNGNLSLSKKSKNLKDVLSATASFSLNSSSNGQHIKTNTLYYNKDTEALLKDSLLNRDVNSKLNDQQLGFGLNYSVGLKKPKDTLARQSLNFGYNGSIGSSKNDVTTVVFDNVSNKTSVIDSLSTSFNTVSFNQSLAMNYNYNSRKARYNLGFNVNANMINNHDLKLKQTNVNNAINYSPSFNLSRTLALGKILSVNYQGSTRSPTINQLQPVKNAQSLQNIVVGNPDLKVAFSHSLGVNFNYAHKSGRSLQVGANASVTQNEIVDDVILLPDTLNSLKQITRYENINGNYQVSSNYQVHVPIKQNKYSLSYMGRLGFSNRAILFNHNKTSGKGFNLYQQVAGNLTFKKVTVNTQFSYSITNNNSSGSRLGSFGYQPIGIGQISAPTFLGQQVLPHLCRVI
ncbi:outer membrane beta-barrel protein [Mucilaginibacter antarcticus]|uniref:outer membrane beta-barrel protein n=1 Tax=Mucilaginibacter antarcticus TaxID=1855725 RepID=UPI0036332C05